MLFLPKNGLGRRLTFFKKINSTAKRFGAMH